MVELSTNSLFPSYFSLYSMDDCHGFPTPKVTKIYPIFGAQGQHLSYSNVIFYFSKYCFKLKLIYFYYYLFKPTATRERNKKTHLTKDNKEILFEVRFLVHTKRK